MLPANQPITARLRSHALADLAIIRDSLRAAIDAGCDDLHACAGNDCCPIPFYEITLGHPDDKDPHR